jgi:AcrR family transcriptional regulator
MRAVARRLGISLAALQYHYPTKAALLGAFVSRLVADHEERIAQFLETTPVQDRLGVVVRSTLEVAFRQSEGGLLSMIEVRAQHDPVAAAVLSDFTERYLSALVAIISELYPALSQREVALAGVVVAALIDGACGYLNVLDGLGLDRDLLIEGVVDSACHSVEALARRHGAEVLSVQREPVST